MLGAEFEARSGDKGAEEKLILRQHHWKVIQIVMEHTVVLAEAWINEWREVARDKEIWKKASERTVETVKWEATAKCEESWPGQTRRRNREPGAEGNTPGRNMIGHESVS